MKNNKIQFLFQLIIGLSYSFLCISILEYNIILLIIIPLFILCIVALNDYIIKKNIKIDIYKYVFFYLIIISVLNIFMIYNYNKKILQINIFNIILIIIHILKYYKYKKTI